MSFASDDAEAAWAEALAAALDYIESMEAREAQGDKMHAEALARAMQAEAQEARYRAELERLRDVVSAEDVELIDAALKDDQGER